jgi:hypothetical protein
MSGRWMNMRASWNELPTTAQIEGYEARSTECAEMIMSFERVPAGLDTTPYLKGLPNNRCQTRHWGYLTKGKILVHYSDHDEVIEAGQAYYLPPDHRVEFLEDCEGVEFSLKEEVEKQQAIIGGAGSP